MELKKNFNNEGFRYSCPECRTSGKPKIKRSSKDSRKRSVYADRENSNSKQNSCIESSKTNSINRNREASSQMNEGDNNYQADSQLEDENQRCSEFYNSDHEKWDYEMEVDTYHHNGVYSKYPTYSIAFYPIKIDTKIFIC